MENRRSHSVYKIIMLVIVTIFITFIITSLAMYKYFTKNTGYGLEVVTNESSSKSDMPSYLKQIRSIINKYYLWKDEVDENKLESGAVEGYVAGLGDDYTEYIPKDELNDYTEALNGKFVGIGVYMIKDTKQKEND